VSPATYGLEYSEDGGDTWDVITMSGLSSYARLAGTSIHNDSLYMLHDTVSAYCWRPGEASISYICTPTNIANMFMTSTGYMFYFSTATDQLMRSTAPVAYGFPATMEAVLSPGDTGYYTGLFY
jgi:hypothetical protein